MIIGICIYGTDEQHILGRPETILVKCNEYYELIRCPCVVGYESEGLSN